MAAETQRPFIFHDPSGRRWTRVRRGAQTFALALILGLVLLILAALSNPQLPSLGLPRVEPLASFGEVRGILGGEHAAVAIPYRLRKNAREIKYRSSTPVTHPKTAARVGESKPIVFGYYVNWDEASKTSLRLNLAHLTHLVPEWLRLRNGNGDLDDESDQSVIDIAAQGKLPILAEVMNFRDRWRPEEVRRVLRDPRLRADLADNIHGNLIEHKFAGVNVDFEQLDRQDREPLVTFMTELKAKLQPAGLLLTQAVPVDDAAYDLKRLAQINDYIVPMVYDEHYQSGGPGPVASQQWFEDELDKLSRIVPARKTVIGVGGYGYDWIIGKGGAAEVTFADVMAFAAANRASVAWDRASQNPVLRFQNGGGSHEIWFLDAVTALNHIQNVNDDGYRGIALWRLGAEDPGVWKVLRPGAWPAGEDKFETARLFPLSAQNPLKYGDGEFLRVTETPHDGRRNVWFANDNYLEKYERYPTNYVVERSGRTSDKVRVLTFDDGPDPEYTPKILDILRSRNVRATFFVIGANAERDPSLIRREYAEGHEIGNHTYSHPNIAATSAERTRLELTAAVRIIENLLGVSTALFRPPYNADSNPETPDEFVPIWRAQQAGYITVAEGVDPRDWEPGSTPEGILKIIREQQDEGNIILLHDGGGDRTATVAALPRIIDYFRQRGYRFTLAGDLIHKTRARLMPAASAEEMRWARIEGQAFDAKSHFEQLVGILFLVAIWLTLLRSIVCGFLAVLQKYAARKRRFDPGYRPSVSVIIAAYNEEKVIVRTIQSVLDNGYSDFELVVVNDGSKDATLAVLEESFGGHPGVRILSQPNGGKSAALNNAIAHSRHDILIALDADTIFRRGTIEKLVRHFADPRIGAVSGCARVGNRNKWITRFQSIEYICGFNLDRRALDLLNAITVVPGAVGAWRKELVAKLGGFGHDTLAEDTDLTLAVRRRGHVIRYEEEAVAYTEAPEDTRGLARQRFRWAFGTLQAAWKHRDAMFVPSCGSLGFVALPSIWIFQVMLSALSPFAELAMIIAVFAGNGRVVLAYYLGFFVLELLTGILAFRLEGEKPWSLGLLFFQRIYYRELMYYVLAKSLIFAMRGRLVGWGKLERRATVQGV